MSDGSDPQGRNLTGRIGEWVVEFYYFMAWATDAMGPQPEDTAADAMLATLRNPRPADLTAPPEATEAEATEIDGAYEDLVAQLLGHGFNPDLGDAPAQADAIRQMVAAVPKRVEEDARRREALRGRLNGMAAPEGVTKAEGEALATDVAALLGRLDSARGPDFDGLENEASALEQRVLDLGLVVVARTKAAEVLAARLALCKAPDGCLPAEASAIGDRAQVLTEGLTKPYDDKMLSDAEAATSTLEAYILALEKTVGERIVAAKALLDRLADCTAPADCVPDEQLAITTRAEDLRKALAEPYSDPMISDAAPKVDTLETDREALVQRVAARALEAKALLDRLALCSEPADCVPDEGLAITTRAEDLRKALTKPYSDAMIGDATPLVDKLVADREALVQRVAARGVEAKALLDRLAKCTAPAGCLPDEGKGVDDRALALTNGLTQPYGDKMLKDADIATGVLEQDLAQLVLAVQAREARAQKLALDLDALAMPPDVNQPETDEITTAVADAKKLLVAPYSDGMLDDADKALLDINTRLGEIAIAAADRVARRKALTDRLDKLAYAPEATPPEIAAFGKTRTACRAEIAAATDDAAIVTADANVDKLEKEVAAHALFAAARAVGQGVIDTARATLKAEASAIDQTYQASLHAAILAAAAALAKAKAKGDVDNLVAALGLVTAKLADAKAYSAHLDVWLVKTAFYVTSANDPVVTAARDTAKAAAEAQALAGDYAAAIVSLDAFETAAGVTKADMDEAEAYRLRRLAFDASHGNMLGAITKSKITGSDPVLQAVTDAKALAAAGNYGDAIKALNVAEPKIAALHKCIDLWRKLSAMVTNATPPLDPVRVAVEQANVELAAGQRGAAFNTLNAVPGPSKDLAAAKARNQRLAGLVGALASGNNPHKTWAKATLPANNAVIAGANFVVLNAAMDTVETRIAEVRAWQDADARVRPMQTAFDPTAGLGLLAGADAEISGAVKDYKEAVKKLAVAETALRLLGEFRALETQVERLVAAQVPASAGHTLADTALTEARALLNVQKKTADAIARLKLVLADPVQMDLAAVDTVWVKRLAATTARQARVTRILTDPARPEPTAELAAKFDAARDKGEVDHKYDDATVLLDAHDLLLGTAQPMAAARMQMRNLYAALTRAEAAFPGDLAKIYEGKPKAEIDTEMADADDKARLLDFAGAMADYKSLVAACKTLSMNTATLYEKADKAGTNAGHSLDRHGPQIDDADLLIRLQTGLAPDGKMSFCSASSRFDDPQAWLAGREKALEEAAAAGKVLSQTSYLPNVQDKDLKYEAIIDHGEAIDRAFKGVKKNVGVKADGSVGELQSYETYEELEGITKSKTLVLFVIEAPADGNPKNPKTVKAYKERYKAMNEEFNRDYSPPLPPRDLTPPDIPGRWVVMQHFPLVEGWDQEKGDYV